MHNLNLKLVLEVIDRMTGPIKRARENITASVGRIRERFSGLGQDLRFRTWFAFALVGEAIGKFGKRMTTAGEKLKKFSKELRAAGGLFTQYLTLPIIGLGTLAVRQAGKLQELSDRMTGLTGNAKAAGDMVKRLRDFSERAPFDLEDVGQAAQQLMALGYSADGAMKRLELLAPIATVTHQQIAALTQTYINVRKSAQLSTDDIMTMAGQGIPILPVLAKQLHTTKTGVMQLAQAGDIGFGDFKKALQSMTAKGGFAADAISRDMNQVGGVFTHLKNVVLDAFGDIGDQLFKSLRMADKVNALSDKIKSLTKRFMNLPEPVKNFIAWAALITATLGPAIFAVGQMTLGLAFLFKGIGGLLGIIGVLTEAVGSFAAALIATPIGWITLAIAGLAFAGYELIKHWDKVKTFFGHIWDGIKSAFKSGVNAVMDKLQPLFDAFERIKHGWNALKGVFGASSGLQAAREASAPRPAPTSLRGVWGPVMAPVKVDTGGTLHIRIDQDGQARVTGAKSNNPGMSINADTGLILGGY
ncbi:MAG: hypothetical protein GC185_01895 [Alphaproteobacteria bacterium]|nr:hypothetical protein [Alphaproteobacteria bacterium]